jgi:hypothetical protein
MKEKDLICSECGYVYPIKSNRNFVKIKGFKYVYCFRCGEFTKHQTIDSVDLYKKELETKDTLEMSGKDRICKKLLKIK